MNESSFIAFGPLGTPELIILSVFFGLPILAVILFTWYKRSKFPPDSPDAVRYKGVGGWLLLFCISLTIIGPLTALSEVADMRREITEFGDHLPSLTYALMTILTLELIVTAVGFYAGFCLWSVRSGAVRITKRYLGIYLGNRVISTLAIFLFHLPAEVHNVLFDELAASSRSGLAFFVVWYLFIIKSKRVKATYSS